MMPRTSGNRSSSRGVAAVAVAFVMATLAWVGPMSTAARAIEIQRVVSPSGIEAWLVEEDTVPLVAMSFAFVGGASQDPPDLPGVANMVSGLLDEGAGNLDSEAFQSALEDLSIELSFGADRDTFGGSLRTLVENLDEAARLLRLALTEPRFDDEPVERIRAQVIAGIRSGERDPDTVASQALLEAAFSGHPYGRPLDGTIETVAAIDIEDLRTYYGKNIARDNLRIAVVGAIDAAVLAELLDTVFAGLPVKANLDLVRDVDPSLDGRIDIAMSIPQTVMKFAGKGLVRSDPDFIPAAIAMRILGGGAFSSRLYEEVREKRGLAYSIGLGLRAFDHAGMVIGGTRTAAGQSDEVIALVEEEIAQFIAKGPTDEELEAAKAYLIGSYPLRFTSSTRIARQLLAIQLDDLGIDYVDRRNDLIAAVTVEDVRRATQRLFDTGIFTVRVGQPES